MKTDEIELTFRFKFVISFIVFLLLFFGGLLMKKQIFMLIINTALFVTNPLFAMEVPEDQHACPMCKKEMVRFPSNKMEQTEKN